MALGYCKECDKLVPVRPKEQKPGSRERWWFPVEHERPEGGSCDGHKRGI